MKLQPEKASEALRKVGEAVAMDENALAAAAYDIANAHMADLIRLCTIEKGYDPREFVLYTYGGAGPLMAAVYGNELGVKEVVVPNTASTNSALGLATSDILHTHSLYESHLNNNWSVTGKTIVEGNPLLEREKINAYEIGYKGRALEGSMVFDAEIFYNKVEDMAFVN